MASAALIGLGWSLKVQLPCFELSHLPIKYVIGRNASKLQSLKLPNSIKTTTDINDAIRNSDDSTIFVITTPPSTHYQYAHTLLSQSKHILCEKPFTITIKEAEKLVQLSKQKSTLALIDHELRTLQAFRKTRQFLSSPKFGKLQQLQVNFRGPLSIKNEWNWWSLRSEGGGVLGAIGSHLIDALNFLIGERVTAVAAHLDTTIKTKSLDGEQKEVTSDDYASLNLRIGSVNATMNLSSSAVGLAEKNMKFGSNNGTLVLDLETLKCVFYSKENEMIANGEDYQVEMPNGLFRNCFSVGTVLIARLVKEAIESGNYEKLSDLATFEDGLNVQRVIEAAHESNDSQGKWVQIDY